MSREPELHIALAGLRVVAALAVPVVGIAALLAGRGGLLGAGLGVLVVGGMLAMSGGLLAAGGRRGPEWLLGAALGGFLARLVAYAVLIVVLRPLEAIHGPSLAISAALLLVASLAYEVRLVQTTPGFFWLDTGAVRAPTSEAREERTYT